MNLSILKNAEFYILQELETPVFVRFVPPVRAAPAMVMAYGMELIERTFGNADLSGPVLGAAGVDYERLEVVLNAATLDNIPVVMLGGSFAFVNICDELENRGRRWRLPSGSRVIDGGGFKSRSRKVEVDELRAMVSRTFGISGENCRNLFGMTELASQLYDGCNEAVGPGGERPKESTPFIQARVRNPASMALSDFGKGLLEVLDLCILDRPPVVLTGDLGIVAPTGIAIVGRLGRRPRGCSLTLDAVTAREAHSECL